MSSILYAEGHYYEKYKCKDLFIDFDLYNGLCIVLVNGIKQIEVNKIHNLEQVLELIKSVKNDIDKRGDENV